LGRKRKKKNRNRPPQRRKNRENAPFWHPVFFLLRERKEEKRATVPRSIGLPTSSSRQKSKRRWAELAPDTKTGHTEEEDGNVVVRLMPDTEGKKKRRGRTTRSFDALLPLGKAEKKWTLGESEKEKEKRAPLPSEEK